jgi:hypothetical protein
LLVYNRAVVNSTPYTILNDDESIGVDTSTIAITVTLPQISTIGLNNYKKYFIVDENGNAFTNNITINTTGGDTINGNSSYIINTNYETVSLYSNGSSNWHIH